MRPSKACAAYTALQFAMLDAKNNRVMITDVTMLSEHMGTSILVAREGVTRLGDLIETVKRFTPVGAKVTGVVFNAVRPRPGKYGYGYGKNRYSGYAYEQYTKKATND